MTTFKKHCFVLKDSSVGLVGFRRSPHQCAPLCCRWSISDGLNKREQTEAGHRLECEGHSWPRSSRSVVLSLLFSGTSLALRWHAEQS